MMGSILDARSPTYVGGISSSYAPCANNYIMIEPRTATFFFETNSTFLHRQEDMEFTLWHRSAFKSRIKRKNVTPFTIYKLL